MPRFTRKPATVDAVRIVEVHDKRLVGSSEESWLKALIHHGYVIPTHRGVVMVRFSETKDGEAKVGDWLVCENGATSIYSDEAFRREFVSGLVRSEELVGKGSARPRDDLALILRETPHDPDHGFPYG